MQGFEPYGHEVLYNGMTGEQIGMREYFHGTYLLPATEADGRRQN
jgi:DNA-directed RNA polymerase beta subunit